MNSNISDFVSSILKTVRIQMNLHTLVQKVRLKSVSRIQQVFIVLLSVACITGCGGAQGMGSISGKVTLKGEPVTTGRIGFLSKETGKGAAGDISSTGEFEINSSLPAGTYTVTVNPPSPKPPQEGEPVTKPPNPKGFPKKFRSSETSDLKVEVKSGSNQLEIDMVP